MSNVVPDLLINFLNNLFTKLNFEAYAIVDVHLEQRFPTWVRVPPGVNEESEGVRQKFKIINANAI